MGQTNSSKGVMSAGDLCKIIAKADSCGVQSLKLPDGTEIVFSPHDEPIQEYAIAEEVGPTPTASRPADLEPPSLEGLSGEQAKVMALKKKNEHQDFLQELMLMHPAAYEEMMMDEAIENDKS